MTASNAVAPFGHVQINATPTYLGGITRISEDPGIALAALQAGGIDINFRAISKIAAAVTIESHDIKAVLDACALSGRSVDAASGTPTTAFKYWWQVYQDGGIFKSGGNHIVHTVNKGLMIPTTISIPRDGFATIQAVVLAVHDGSNDPIVRASGQSLPSVTPSQVAWFNGPYYIEGAEGESQGGSFQAGLSPLLLGASGTPYNTFAALAGRAPAFNLATHDEALLATVLRTGTKLTQDALVYLRKGDRNGLRVADGTAEHILFTIADGIAYPGGAEGSAGGAATFDIRIAPSWDASNDMVQIDTTAAIA
jgi:hypothetical protein